MHKNRKKGSFLRRKQRSVREILHSSVPKLLKEILSASALAYQDRNIRRMREKKVMFSHFQYSVNSCVHPCTADSRGIFRTIVSRDYRRIRGKVETL